MHALRRCDQSAVQQVFRTVRLINRSLESADTVRADADQIRGLAARDAL